MNDFFYEGDIAEIAKELGNVAEKFAGKSILISGGGGFLGRYFVQTFDYLNRHTLKAPCRVLALDNFITSVKGTDGAISKDIELREHDVIQPFRFDGKIDYILHAAGIASPFYYRAYPLQTLDVGVTGTRNMLELAKEKHAKIAFFSSSEIYGDPDPKYVPTPESYRGNISCLGPRACYDESKRLGETLCQIYHTQFGVHTNIIRPFNVYGPGMKEKDYRVLPNFASRIAGNRPISIYGTGNQTRTFCYITDAINGFLRVLSQGVPSEPYNIGNPKPEIGMHELANLIEETLGRPIKKDIVSYPDSYPADEPMRRCPDISKARIQLGFEPKVDLRTGLKRYFAWTKENYKGEL